MADDREKLELARLQQEIAQRLRAACNADSPEDFDALVGRMARIQRKYALRRDDELMGLARRVDGLRRRPDGGFVA